MEVSGSRQIIGAVALVLGALMSATSQALVKMTAQKEGVSATQISLLRALSQNLIVILPSMIWQRVTLLPRRREAPRRIFVYIVVRGILGGANFLMGVWVVMYLPLGDGQALQDMYPVLTAPLAWFFLRGEQLLKSTIPALLLSATGILLITQPTVIFGGGESQNTGSGMALFGTICGVACSVTMAIKFILARKAMNAHTLQLVVWMNIFQVIIGLSCCVAMGETVVLPDFKGWLQILGIIVTNLVYLFGMTFGQQMVPAAFASILMSTDIVWSYLLEVVMFRGTPSVLTLGGVSLIVAANSLLTIEKMMVREPCSDPASESFLFSDCGELNTDEGSKQQLPSNSSMHSRSETGARTHEKIDSTGLWS